MGAIRKYIIANSKKMRVMKRFFKIATNFLFLKNKKLRTANYLISGFALIYIGLIIYPNILFGYSVKYKSFHIFSNNPIDYNINKIIDDTETNLSSSEIYEQNITHKVFLCNSYSLYTFFVPFSRRAFACNYPLINNTFIAKSNIAKNESYKNDAKDNYIRKLSETVAHEITHAMTEKKLGLWKYITLENWKNEGYSETIGYNDTLNMAIVKDFLKINKNNDGYRVHYRKCYFAVAYLMQIEKMKFEDIVATKLTLDEVLKKIETK